MTDPRPPAFYALRAGGWRDYITLLHPPYTLWHLSYVCIGWATSERVHTDRLIMLLAAFFLAVGIGAHALDELRGRPLKTRIPTPVLVAAATLAIGGAVAIGVYEAARTSWSIMWFVLIGGFLVVAYNLELFGGAFHSDLWFGLAWGAFPVLTGYFVTAERLTDTAAIGAGFGLVTSLAQRVLSTEVRDIRRRGTADPAVLAAPEAALRLLSVAMIVLAAALVSLRW